VLPIQSEHRVSQIYLKETFENKTNFFRAEKKAPETTCCLLRAGFFFGLLLDPEDGVNIFLRNVNCLLVYYIALYPRRQSFRNHLCVNLLHKMYLFSECHLPFEDFLHVIHLWHSSSLSLGSHKIWCDVDRHSKALIVLGDQSIKVFFQSCTKISHNSVPTILSGV
jgi:hypothetical protein